MVGFRKKEKIQGMKKNQNLIDGLCARSLSDSLPESKIDLTLHFCSLYNIRYHALRCV